MLYTNKHRDMVENSAMGFLDDIYDRMRKEGYPQELQNAIISQIKSLLN